MSENIMPLPLSNGDSVAAESVALSVVIPVRNEAGNIMPLAEEIYRALADRVPFEVIFVDDGSDDGTAAKVIEAMQSFPAVRCLQHATGLGQSAGLRTGIVAARGELIVTMDGDGQNDPADISRLLDAFDESPDDALGMIAGQRVLRQDRAVRRFSSWLANGLRRRLLNDGARDTGCGLKLFPREAFLSLPYFDHMHRFLPALMLRQGYEVRFVGVHHRPRTWGGSKYGVSNRLWVGIMDLIGVMWLRRRCGGARPDFVEIDRDRGRQ